MNRLALLLALLIPINACQAREFGDGVALQEVGLFGEPGPTPTDQRPDGVLVQLWFRSQGRGLVGCRSDGKVILASMDGKFTPTDLHTTEICAFAPDIDSLLLRESGNQIALVQLSNQTRKVVTAGKYVRGAVNGRGTVVALTTGDRKVEVWNINTGDLFRTLPTKMEVRNGLAFSGDGTVLAAAEGTYSDSHRTRLEVWNTRAGKKLSSTAQDGTAANAGVWGIALSQRGKRLAAGTQAGAKGGVQVWSSDLKPVFKRERFSTYWVRALALASDGKTLASGDERGNIVVWDIENDRELANARQEQIVQSVALSPDSVYIAAGLWDSRIGLWKLP